eukprot:CAMPEP_0176155658 /NCGR_PEP_ID=MMETSP0120_2-20121206/79550_1 /TAXON_ID=160619 /ORGANISM="Kryptoperidinium foliaceum, Strain CCMP 1326" /LENGTH=122 /DNA_ID=CAMNT_0017492833 /DNA_START=1 /DNA_END=365 /DNA_ORIENTATION=+
MPKKSPPPPLLQCFISGAWSSSSSFSEDLLKISRTPSKVVVGLAQVEGVSCATFGLNDIASVSALRHESPGPPRPVLFTVSTTGENAAEGEPLARGDAAFRSGSGSNCAASRAITRARRGAR